ncbi:uncharacterized protein YcfL [Rhizobium lusitanum]|uniref:Uncharacterized protein YcfL n=1 Tax=Rhizobium lusitanum TaxID=293958 RepID=A0A7X0IUY8_9HYPH|nr:uncharacterized protein YcfL [Rhizobium lusitanum]
MRYCFAVVLSLLLAGCQSAEDSDRCSNYGFEHGTTEFAVCRQRIDLARREYRERRMERSIEAPNYDY